LKRKIKLIGFEIASFFFLFKNSNFVYQEEEE